MKVAGIIAEYNPFHNGHFYHVKKTKELTGADYVIAVLSGDYVQRGVPAFLDKETRTRMALQCGVDLVIELPMAFATSAAADFASYGVHLLNATGITDFLSFGCEIGDLSILDQIASVCQTEPPEFKQTLKESLGAGLSYPKARQLAIEACLPSAKEIPLEMPNLILAVEYLGALQKSRSSIKPVFIKRSDKGYHSQRASGQFLSASAIRSLCLSQEPSAVIPYMPKRAFQLLATSWKRFGPLSADDFSQALGYRLLACRNEPLWEYADISRELANRMKKNLTFYSDYEGFAQSLKTKAYTRVRINRALLHLLFSITKQDMEKWKKEPVPYIRVLGFQKKAASLLAAMKTYGKAPVLAGLSHYEAVLSPEGKDLLEKELTASRFYEQTACKKYNIPLPREEARRPLIVEEG